MEAAPASDGASAWPLRARPAHASRLLAHLVRRELTAHHRFSLLGVFWPLVRVLAQAAVLTFIFTEVIDVGIPDYGAFLLIGLIVWTWFSRGLSKAARSVLNRPNFVFQPGFSLALLPVVAVLVALVDLAVALPVLAAVLMAIGSLDWSALLLPLLLAIQLVLLSGLALGLASVSVYLRDVPDLVDVVLLTLFYATPVIYELARVPDDWQWVLELNPIAILIEAYRDVLLGGTIPELGPLAAVAAASAAACVVGALVFRRLRPGFIDAL